MVDTNFLAGQSSIWVQPDGPNTKPVYLGCHGAGDLEEPQGDVTLLFCPDPANAGKYVVKNSFQGAPDSVTLTLNTDVRKTADYLETVKFSIPVFIHKVLAGRRDDFTNFDRTFVLRSARITNRTLGNLASRNPDDEGESTQTFELAALELLRIFYLGAARITLSEATAITGLAVGGEDRPESGLSSQQEYGDLVMLACKAGTGVTANVLFTKTGSTPAATAADPFSTDEDLAGALILKVGRDSVRLITGRGETVAGEPCKIAYSDDDGATWTKVTVGSTNGEFLQSGHALFALDLRNIWLGTSGGNIYYSADGGVTFTKQTASVLGAAVVGINFFDATYGYAVLSDGDVYKTVDGGNTWGAVTACGTAGTATDIHALTRYLIYVSASDGLYYSHDAGNTFAKRNSNAIGAMDFKNELEGIAVGSGASGIIYQTVDGGYTWSPMTLVANSGMTQARLVNSRLGYVAGGVHSGTAFLANLTPVA